MNNPLDSQLLVLITDFFDQLNTVPAIAAIVINGKPFRQYFKDKYQV